MADVRKPRTPKTEWEQPPLPNGKEPKQPQDRRAKGNPLKGQDEGDRVLQVDFLGVRYVIQKEDVDDVELFELIEDGKAITAVRTILGPDRWADFKLSARGDNGRVTLTTLNDFLNELMTAIGGSRGN